MENENSCPWAIRRQSQAGQPSRLPHADFGEQIPRCARDDSISALAPEARTLPSPNGVQCGSRRAKSPRGEEARRGSVSEGGTRRAVEALWPSHEPVRRQAQIPTERKRRGV